MPVSFKAQRRRMVEDQILRRGVTDCRVLQAFLEVPRHEFVPQNRRHEAYRDSALSIGEGQTISQPYMVASMTEAAKVKPADRILEIGTGSGYQAAILAEVVKEVATIEIIEPLSKEAQKTAQRLGYKNIHFKVGDGYKGWPEHAPFDGIIVTAAAPKIPKPLTEQLKEGGKLVIPVGIHWQELMVITKTTKGTVERTTLPVRFVPMVGEVQDPKSR